MKFLEAVQQRYTTKAYDRTKKIDDQLIDELKQILHLCPSSINSQPWQFTFVRDKETKEQLAVASLFNEQKVKDSDTLIVFSAINNIDGFEKQIEEHLPEGAIAYYHRMVKLHGEEYIKNWLQKQVYLSLGLLLGACAAMKIDATPMEGIEPDKYDAIINGDRHYTTLFSVAIGYRDPQDEFQPDKRPKQRIALDEIIRSIG